MKKLDHAIKRSVKLRYPKVKSSPADGTNNLGLNLRVQGIEGAGKRRKKNLRFEEAKMKDTKG